MRFTLALSLVLLILTSCASKSRVIVPRIIPVQVHEVPHDPIEVFVTGNCRETNRDFPSDDVEVHAFSVLIAPEDECTVEWRVYQPMWLEIEIDHGDRLLADSYDDSLYNLEQIQTNGDRGKWTFSPGYEKFALVESYSYPRVLAVSLFTNHKSTLNERVEITFTFIKKQ